MTYLKLGLTVAIILLASSLGKKYPIVSALLVVMPLTSLLVILWLYADNSGDIVVVDRFVRNAVMGIIPTIVFFLVMIFCLARKWSFGMSLATSLSVWAMGAFVYQYIASRIEIDG